MNISACKWLPIWTWLWYKEFKSSKWGNRMGLQKLFWTTSVLSERQFFFLFCFGFVFFMTGCWFLLKKVRQVSINAMRHSLLVVPTSFFWGVCQAIGSSLRGKFPSRSLDVTCLFLRMESLKASWVLLSVGGGLSVELFSVELAHWGPPLATCSLTHAPPMDQSSNCN